MRVSRWEEMPLPKAREWRAVWLYRKRQDAVCHKNCECEYLQELMQKD